MTLNPRQFKTQMMPVSELLPHAADRRYNDHQVRYVDALTESMRKHGFSRSLSDTSRVNRYMEREHGTYAYDPQPVTLNHDHTNGETYIEPGNHRVAAAHAAGIEQIPVRVRHFR